MFLNVIGFSRRFEADYSRESPEKHGASPPPWQACCNGKAKLHRMRYKNARLSAGIDADLTPVTNEPGCS
jgi:hypothetical protein